MFRHQPLPAERERLGFTATYSQAEFARMEAGFVSQDMDDKWDIGMEDGWLLFCRSWTGHCCLAVRFEPTGEGWTAVDSWASRETHEYRSPGAEFDREMLRRLIEAKLLTDQAAEPDHRR